MLTLLLTAILPALVLVYFIYRKDKYEKEPTDQLLKGFGFGILSALASFLISIPSGLLGFYPAEPAGVIDNIRVALFGAAVPEEIAKFFFLWLLLRNNKYYNEYVDGIVYAVCVGMGFAAFENVGYMFTNLDEWASIGIVRALVPIPGHFFFAVAMGYFFSNAAFGTPSGKALNIALAIIVPIILHAVFDALLMISTIAGATGSVLLVFLSFFVWMAIKSKKRFDKQLKKDEENIVF